METVASDPVKPIDFVYKIVGIAKDVTELSYSRKDVGQQLEQTESKLRQIQIPLQLLSNWFSSRGESSYTETSFSRPILQSEIDNCFREIEAIQASILTIKQSRDSFLFRMFPSHTKKAITGINDSISSVKSVLEKIKGDINGFIATEESTVANFGGPDRFLRVTNMVPNNPEGMHFEFTATGADGTPLTCAGKLKAAILDVSENRSVSAVAQGMGGVGKTCALRAIGQDADIKKRFPGGVLFFSLGQDAGETQLKDRIAYIVERAGGHKRAENIRKLDKLDDVIDTAVSWFDRYPCLFIIDDIWEGEGITKNTIVTLSNLAKHEGSRIAYTTRDKKLQSHVNVDFSPRAADGEESKQMLLNHANLDYPSSKQARKSFHAVLHSCGGLPLALAIAGGAVRFLAENRCHGNHEKAWHKYDSIWKIESEERVDLTERLLKSLNFIDQETRTHRCRFEAMGVLRKGQNVTVKILSALWGVQMFEAKKEIKSLERFSIVRCSEGASGELVGLHDIILDISRELAGDTLWSHSRRFIKWCLAGSKQDEEKEILPGSASHDEAGLTSEQFRQGAFAIERDEYILSNLCRLLKLGGLNEDVFWLVRQPSWIVRRLDQDDKRDVLGDLEIASECLHSIPWTSNEKQLATDWLRRLKNCLVLSASSIILIPHRCTPWFQLYGRLMYSESQNVWVGDFLNKIKIEVPRPWLKPCYGCLAPAGEHLKTVINTQGNFLHFIHQENLISAVSVIGTNVVNILYDANDGRELERSTLGADLPKDDIHMTALSQDGNTYVCGTTDGKLWIFSRDEQDTYNNRSHLISGNDTMTVQQVNVQKRATEETSGTGWRHYLPEKEIVISQVGKSKTSHRDGHISQECNAGDGAGVNVLLRSEELGSTFEWCQDKSLAVKRERVYWDRFVLNGHTDWIRCVAITSDGKRIVSGSEDKTVRLWEKENKKWDCCVLTGHTDWIRCVVINQNGKQVVSGSDDNTVRVWEKKYEKWGCCILTGHTNWIRCVAISQDGKQVVSGSEDKTVRVWEKKDEKWKCFVLTGHMYWIECVAISRDKKHVVSGSNDCTVRVWERKGQKWDCCVLTGHTDSVGCVAISKDGKLIVSGADDKTVRVWEKKDKKWDCCVLTGHTDWIRCISISNNAKQVISGSDNKMVRVWERRDEKRDSFALTGHTNWIRCVAISKDGKRIVSGSEDKTVRVWERDDEKWNCSILTGHKYGIECVAINKDGKQVVSGSDDNTVRVWEKKNKKWDCCVLKGHTDSIGCIAINTYREQVVSGSDDNTVRVWERKDEMWDCCILKGHTDWIRCIAINKDGKQVVSGSDDNTVRVWEKKDEKWDCCVLTGHSYWIECVAISQDGKEVVSGSWDDTVRVWEKKDKKWDCCVLTGHTDLIACVAIGKDGKQVVSGSWDNTVRVWEKKDEKWDCCVLAGHTYWIRSVTINKDGTQVRSEYCDGKVLHWQKKHNSWRRSSVGSGFDCDEDWDSRDDLSSSSEPATEQEIPLNLIAQKRSKSISGIKPSIPNIEKDITNIEFVRKILEGDEIWATRSGYCVKFQRSPFLVFVDLVN